MIKFGLATSFVAGATLLLATAASQPDPSKSVEYPTPTIREEQKVVVGGVVEVWQLKWTTPPKPVCEPSADSLTCPCNGFAYGEGGNLTLFRLRDGKVVDHLDLSQFFDDGPADNEKTAVVRRWEPDYDKDFDAMKRQDFPALVTKRRVAQVMQFADYEHNGWQSEFYLQTESGPCGHRSGIVIGVSKGNQRLHAVGAASKPTKALYLHEDEWDALRRKPGPFEILDWACGDHAAETEIRLWLRWKPKGVDGTRREYGCLGGFRPGKLLREGPLSPVSETDPLVRP
jgi:hypothetical protein